MLPTSAQAAAALFAIQLHSMAKRNISFGFARFSLILNTYPLEKMELAFCYYSRTSHSQTFLQIGSQCDPARALWMGSRDYTGKGRRARVVVDY